MSAATAHSSASGKPSLLFIDDEPRVLKSMRAMFRRDYEVYLANSGQEALTIVAENQIQVVVSDQRMPKMTGVEVLTEIKHKYPDIVRILLTGYADLEAIEASLNEAEVFRYLMKPCPADEVRSAVKSGLDQAKPVRTAQVIQLASAAPTTTPNLDITNERPPNAAPSAAVPSTVHANKEQPTPSAPTTPKRSASTISHSPTMSGHIALLGSGDLADAVAQAVPRAKVSVVASLASAIKLDSKTPIAVLIADVPSNEISDLSQKVTEQLPDAVILAASDKSDASLLINLINSGTAFRFLVKPVQAGRLKLTLNSAFERYALSSPDSDSPTGTTWQKFVDWLLGRTA